MLINTLELNCFLLENTVFLRLFHYQLPQVGFDSATSQFHFIMLIIWASLLPNCLDEESVQRIIGVACRVEVEKYLEKKKYLQSDQLLARHWEAEAGLWPD